MKRGTTDKDAQQYWCKDCETYFNDLRGTIFGQCRFELGEMFYIIKEMQSELRFRSSRTLTETMKPSLTSSTKSKTRPARLVKWNWRRSAKLTKST